MIGTVKNFNETEVKDLLISRLQNGWAIIDGGTDVIWNIEQEYYQPGTPKNALFELIFGSVVSPTNFYCIIIAKKDCLPDTFQKEDTRYIYFGHLENKLVCYQLCSRDVGIPNICESVLQSLGVVTE